VKHRGHPIRGAIAGLFFGLFVSLDLVIFGVLALDADLLALFPVLGLLGGIALGLTAPLKRRPAQRTEGQPEDPPVVGALEAAPSKTSPVHDHDPVSL
jgi:hypothetical protein